MGSLSQRWLVVDPRLDRRRLARALAFGPKSIHGHEDALVEPLVKPLPLRCIGGHVGLLAAAHDPGGNAIRDHATADMNADQGVVLLQDLNGDLEDQTGVIHEPPALLPARLPIEVAGDVHGVVGDDTLAGLSRAGEQPADIGVEVTRDPTHQ